MTEFEKLRLSKGFSERALAKAAGLAVNTLRRFERGEVVTEKLTVFKIAKALEVDPELLLSKIPTAPKQQAATLATR